jgi:hypothetical protein
MPSIGLDQAADIYKSRGIQVDWLPMHGDESWVSKFTKKASTQALNKHPAKQQR